MIIMEIYLQFAHGMMGHCNELVDKCGFQTIILSPCDLNEQRFLEFASQMGERNVDLLIDPQLYFPASPIKQHQTHKYWPKEIHATNQWIGNIEVQSRSLSHLIELATQCKAKRFIMPSTYLTTIDKAQLHDQSNLINIAGELWKGDILASLVLSPDLVKSEAQLEELLQIAVDWDVAGYYVIAAHPQGNYLVDDATWLAGVMDLASVLALTGKIVIQAYSGHQLLSLAAAGVTALAAGSNRLTRTFPVELFNGASDVESRRQQAIWYYCPQALSEFTIDILDLANRQGRLNDMKPLKGMPTTYCQQLFTGQQPSATDYDRRSGKLHYLESILAQARSLKVSNYRDCFNAADTLLNQANADMTTFHKYRLRARDRDFIYCYEATSGALGFLNLEIGHRLMREWPQLAVNR
ncbi:MAG TPA: hypothetical protein VND01_00725 [Candidatus Acidoferrales bacterium]|nr:hypothetical protein [Candidatus Acidoferrales bacterium]